MIGSFLTNVVFFILYLPFRILLSIRFSAIFTLLGFIFGLLAGLGAGYYFFIFPEPSDVRDIDVPDLSEERGELSLDEKRRLYKLLPPWVHSPDSERISWFNRMLGLMWPFIDKAVAEQVLAQTADLFEKSKPSFIDKIEFESLTLGSLSPAFIGIKSFETMEDEVIIQPELRWCGRPNIKLVARIKQFGFSVDLSAHITHIWLQAPVRITLKPLSNNFPCFSKIVVSLMSAPQVDLGLSVLGLDPLVWPMMNQIVEAQVENAVSSMLLWPQPMVIYNEEAKKIVGKLIIRDVRANDLKNVAGLVSTIDPFVRFGFGKKVGNFQTKVEKDETNPVWDEEGAVSVREDVDELLVEVFHKKKPKNVLIGAAWVQFSDIMQQPDIVIPIETKLLKEVPKQEEAPANGEGGAAPPAAPSISKAPSALRMSLGGKSGKAKEPKNTGTVSFSLEFKPRKTADDNAAADDPDALEDEEEIVVDAKTPVGGGKLWVKLRSGHALEAKKEGFDHPTVYLKFQGLEQKSQRYKEPEVDIFDDTAFTWDCKTKPDKESLYVRVVATAKGATLGTVTNPLALKRILQGQEEVGDVLISLADVVTNGRLLDDYSLKGSKDASLKIEIRWKEKTA